MLHALVYHHLVGADANEMVADVRLAIAEAERVLRLRGRLVVAKPCVPAWFYGVGKLPCRPLVTLSKTRLLGGHPRTIQIPVAHLVALVGERFEVESAWRVPPGRGSRSSDVAGPRI